MDNSENINGYIEAIPDILKSYNVVIENYISLTYDERGRFHVDWLKKEAESLKSMAW